MRNEKHEREMLECISYATDNAKHRHGEYDHQRAQHARIIDSLEAQVRDGEVPATDMMAFYQAKHNAAFEHMCTEEKLIGDLLTLRNAIRSRDDHCTATVTIPSQKYFPRNPTELEVNELIRAHGDHWQLNDENPDENPAYGALIAVFDGYMPDGPGWCGKLAVMIFGGGPTCYEVWGKASAPSVEGTDWEYIPKEASDETV